MPLAATVPNNTIPAPPSTEVGTAAMTRPMNGNRPRITRNTPPVATTKRLLMPVTATSPTFWANALWVKEPKVGAQAIAQTFGVNLGADDFAHGEDVGGGFNQGHHDHDAHRQDRGKVEGRHAEMEGCRKAKHRALAHGREVRHTQEHRDHGADNHGQQNRQT